MAVDPFAAQVTCRLNFEGLANLPGYADDVSPLRNTIKSYGAGQSTKLDKAFGEYSRVFNPSAEATGYLGLTTTGVCDFGLGDYTVEGRSKIITNFDYNVLFASQSSNSAGYLGVVVTATGAIVHGFYDGGGRPQVISAAGVITTGNWFHWRAVRESGVCHLFINGSEVVTPATINVSVQSADPRIGMNPAAGSQHLRGYMDEFVITKASRGTSNFTPPDPYDYTPSADMVFSRLPGLAKKVEYPPPAFAKHRLGGMVAHSPLKSPGIGTVAGTVKEKAYPSNLPLARRVALFRHTDDQKVADGWSDTAGNYAFANVDPRLKYYVVSFDHTGTYRAVIADNLTPTVI